MNIGTHVAYTTPLPVHRHPMNEYKAPIELCYSRSVVSQATPFNLKRVKASVRKGVLECIRTSYNKTNKLT